jgi:hypothetical protein
MSDSLRDRIAAVVYAHDCWDYAGGLECRCDSQFTFDDSDVNGDAIKPWADHVADAVIAELGLRQEWSVEYTPSGEWPRMPQRYEWSCGHERTTEHREQAQFDAASFSQEPGEQAHPVSRYVTDWRTE